MVRIAADGFPTKLWADASEVIYSICLDANGKPVVGTGNKGSVYRIDSELVSTKLLTLPPTQITALVATPKGPIVAVTGNIGKVYAVVDAAGTGAGSVSATLAGTIDLSDTLWASLTADNFGTVLIGG